jgi:hypothetical protein
MSSAGRERIGRFISNITVGCVALATVSALGTSSVYAQCAASGSTQSASATDASTSQALELMRDRRIQVAEGCPSGSYLAASGMCIPLTQASGAAVGPAGGLPAAGQPPAAAPKAAPKAAQTKRPPGAPAGGPGAYAGGYGDAAPPVRYGMWAEGYGDRERREDISVDGQTLRFRSYGVLAGMDHTYFHSAREGVMLGAFAGYNNSKAELNQGATLAGKTQDIEGAMLGLYGTYFHRGFAIDLAVKFDLFDLDQVLSTGCGSAAGSTDLTNYVVASNLYYRHNLGHSYWFEPTLGFRYVRSDFGSGAGRLGLADGEAFRIQGGARIGRDWVSSDRYLWSVSLLGLLYSDVAVDGFVFTAGGATALDLDEGALRVLGQLRAKVTSPEGLTYYGQVEVRGGDEYFGIGGKLGMRVEW